MNIQILNNDHGKSAWNVIAETSTVLTRTKQRRHEFFILTCYVDLNLVEEYVNYLYENVRITNVYLAFNISEIYKNGPKSTAEKLEKIKILLAKKDISFEWKLLSSSKLVHGKGYALIQRSKGMLEGGVVLMTSANFTSPGFKGENVEIGYLTTKKKDINDFINAYKYLENNLGTEMTSAIFKQEEYLLKFALLSSGVFLHKWSGSLSQQIGIKYELTQLAKEKGTIAPELAEVGFETGDTFTRQVLKFHELPAKEIPRSFISRFTIETRWGRWCPLDAWNTLRESFRGSHQFIQQFHEATEESILEHIKENALEIQNDLLNMGLIKPVGENHLNNWVSRINDLRSNYRRLDRIHIGYEANKLPYTIEQKTDVLELFASLMDAIELSKATNIAKGKVILAIKNANLDSMLLTPKEIQMVKEMGNDA